MLIQRPSCVFNLWSCCSSRPNLRPPYRLLQPPVASCAAAQASLPDHTTTGQAFPLLTHTPCYSPETATSNRSRSSQPSYSPPCGHPLLRIPRLWVVPFLGRAVIHHLGALGRYGIFNAVNERYPSKEDCKWRG